MKTKSKADPMDQNTELCKALTELVLRKLEACQKPGVDKCVRLCSTSHGGYKVAIGDATQQTLAVFKPGSTETYVYNKIADLLSNTER